MPLIEQTQERYLRCPRLEPVADGGALLHLFAWEGDQECVLRFDLAEDGSVRAEAGATDHSPAIMTWAPGMSHPINDPEAELAAEHQGWRVEIRHEGPRSSVLVAPPSGGEFVAWTAYGIAAAPCIAAAPGGAWVGFHHDVREDTGVPDVAKWIALRFVDMEGRVFEPAAPMTDRDRDLDGEEQGFEFPTLVVGEDGAIDLFGRGSHNMYRQRLNADGFAAREAIDDGQWGCRGRRVSVVSVASGETLAAWRGRKGIRIGTFDRPVGGSPELVEAKVDVGDFKPAAVHAAAWSGPQVLFGDIQQHSAHSDGVGSADEAYLRARATAMATTLRR